MTNLTPKQEKKFVKIVERKPKCGCPPKLMGYNKEEEFYWCDKCGKRWYDNGK